MTDQNHKITVVGVKCRGNRKTYFFSPNNLKLKKDDKVLVNTPNGLSYGVVTSKNMDIDSDTIHYPLYTVERFVTLEDISNLKKIKKMEKYAFNLCKDRIKKHKLSMKLLAVEYSFDLTKVLFLFSAESRVDFRDLVKDLAFSLRVRIELRQIGVRDQARICGGMGICGQELCCRRFPNNLHSVSIKMAKQQNLSLSPSKISGMCGRLMCCLQYEQEAYADLLKEAPPIGSIVVTTEGEGKVIDVNPITKEVRVKLNTEEFVVSRLHFKDIKEIKAT